MSKQNSSQRFGNVSFKLLKYVIMIILLVICATWAFNFGTEIFDGESVDEKPGTDMTIDVAEGTTVDELADTLEEYGIIKSARVFKVQALIYDVKDVKKGTYIFNTSESGEDILGLVKTGPNEGQQKNEEEE